MYSVYRDNQNRIWIPNDADGIQLRICIIGHTGPAGNRGYSTTLSNVHAHFT